MTRPKGPVKATDKEREDFSALFESDSEDSVDDDTRFMLKSERPEKAKKKQKTAQESDDSDNYR